LKQEKGNSGTIAVWRSTVDEERFMNTDQLTDRHCVEAGSKAKRLKPVEIKSLKNQLGGGWKLVMGKLLEKQCKFSDFKAALAFTIQVGKLAENEGHHPDILLTYGAVRIQLFTHSAKGLTENDFILAAKIEQL
jgi:4a-hydroxytetrahydrobiopterin dehydratase